MTSGVHTPRRGARSVVALAAVVLLAACSADEAGDSSAASGSGPDVTICAPDGTGQADADLPLVGEIPAAVEALEAQLGGPQEYFEINATARVVNLFVALNDGDLVQPWLYVDGQLTSQEAQAAQGGTFVGGDLDFVPTEVLTKVRAEVPDAILESFYVNGDGDGNVQYGVLTSALCGGGLDVVVGPDGAVKSVDPVN